MTLSLRQMIGAALAGFMTCAVLAGCGSGKDESAAGLEKSTLTIGTLPIPYAAPIHLAIKNGYFRAEGLKVKTQEFPGGAAALPKLIGGGIDITLSNHISAIAATAKGTAKLRILGEVDLGVENELPILVPRDSTIRTPKDLQGKTIAVNTLKNLGDLTVSAALSGHGIDVKRAGIKFTEVPFPNMPQALEKKSVDAVWIPEPFSTDAQKRLGARIVLDSLTSAAADLPLDGYVATDALVRNNPKTVAAFKRAIGRAQQLAATSRSAVVEIIPTYTKIDKTTAQLITIGKFTTSTSPVRLQRVADLMWDYGFIDKRFDVRTMLG